MLVLTRHVGQKIMIDGNIVVSVESSTRYSDLTPIRIGIEAPKDIPIVRDDAISRDPKTRPSKGNGAERCSCGSNRFRTKLFDGAGVISFFCLGCGTEMSRTVKAEGWR